METLLPIEEMKTLFAESTLVPAPTFEEYNYATSGGLHTVVVSTYYHEGKEWCFGNSYQAGVDAMRVCTYARHLAVLLTTERAAR